MSEGHPFNDAFVEACGKAKGLLPVVYRGKVENHGAQDTISGAESAPLQLPLGEWLTLWTTWGTVDVFIEVVDEFRQSWKLDGELSLPGEGRAELPEETNHEDRSDPVRYIQRESEIWKRYWELNPIPVETPEYELLVAVADSISQNGVLSPLPHWLYLLEYMGRGSAMRAVDGIIPPIDQYEDMALLWDEIF